MKKKILVVDDQEKWRELLKFQLGTDITDVIAVENKEAALRLLEEMTFNTIIADLRMDEIDDSNIDGFLLVKKIKEIYPNEPMDAIILTGHEKKDTWREATKKYGAEDFVTKGGENDIESLKEAIQEAAQKRDSQKSWEKYDPLRNRTFTLEKMAELGRMLFKKEPPAEDSIRKLNAFLHIILTDEYFPLSTEMIGPKLVNQNPPVIKLVCWSRARQKALLAFIQQGGNISVLPEVAFEVKAQGFEEVIAETFEHSFFGTSGILTTIKDYESFKKLTTNAI